MHYNSNIKQRTDKILEKLSIEDGSAVIWDSKLGIFFMSYTQKAFSTCITDSAHECMRTLFI